MKSSDSVKGDVTVTETVQVKVPGAGAVEGQGLGMGQGTVVVRKCLGSGGEQVAVVSQKAGTGREIKKVTVSS